MIQLKWHGAVPSTVNVYDLEKTILEDIVIHLSSIDKPSKLIYHTIFLGDSMTGPSVLIWGEEGDNEYYHCEYCPTTEWVSLDEDKENFNDPKKLTYK